jgi:hypothetical protein
MQRREPEYIVDCKERLPMAIAWVQQKVLTGLQTGKPVAVRLGRERRNLEQSAKFHAMLGDVSRQVEYMGKMRTAEQWKVLFVSAHAIATGKGADMLPGLEGEFVNIRESTAQMSKKRIASLIEYVYAWSSDKGVRWSEPVPEEYRHLMERCA